MKELEEYAMINKIPIMQKDGILYLCNYIKENNIKNILEIDRKSTRLNSSHASKSRMPSSA